MSIYMAMSAFKIPLLGDSLFVITRNNPSKNLVLGRVYSPNGCPVRIDRHEVPLSCFNTASR